MIVNLTDDATGRKLKKVHDGVNHFYIDGIEYSDDNLLFIATEEGRVRKHETTGSWVYDYFLKDHLGNVRVVLTAAPPTIDAYPAATMETLEAAAEETFYANLPETRMDKPSGFDGYTDANPLNLKVAELGALSGKKVGPSITLKVNAGDKLTLSAKSFYNSQASYSRDQLLPEMLLMLLDGLMNPTGLTGQTGTVAREVANYQVFGSSNSYSSALSSIADNVYNSTEAKPKAFMVWMLFDNEFNLVKSSSGMLQVGAAGAPAKTMLQENLIMDRGGYFYAYLVNESPTSVYFDDFKVTHSAGKVLEENHYYPFGMLNAQLSTQPTDKPLNYYKYNSKELQKELNLEWLDYGARFYDSQLGRWHSVDPMSEIARRWTPYQYCYGNPMRFIDPDGMIVVDANGNAVTVEKDKEGNYTGNFQFAEGTNETVQKQFMENGGTLIKEMLTIDTGKEYVTAAIQSEEKLHYTISEGSPKSSTGSGEYKIGGTDDVKKNGEVIRTDITIYKGSIKEARESGNVDSRLTIEQNMAATAIHETHHGTNRDDIKIRRELGPGQLSKEQHQKAYDAGDKATFEYQLLNGIIK